MQRPKATWWGSGAPTKAPTGTDRPVAGFRTEGEVRFRSNVPNGRWENRRMVGDWDNVTVLRALGHLKDSGSTTRHALARREQRSRMCRRPQPVVTPDHGANRVVDDRLCDMRFGGRGTQRRQDTATAVRPANDKYTTRIRRRSVLRPISLHQVCPYSPRVGRRARSSYASASRRNSHRSRESPPPANQRRARRGR